MHIIERRQRVLAVLAGGLLTASLSLAVAQPAFAQDDNHCVPSSGASPASDPQGAFNDDTNAFYSDLFARWSERTGISYDVTCVVGSKLVNEGAESVVLGPFEKAVLGTNKLNKVGEWVYEQIFERAVDRYLEEGQQEANNPLLVPVGPEEGSAAVAQTYTVDDAILGGSWGRSDAMDGTWAGRGLQPSNGEIFYENQSKLGVVCAIPGAAYTVHYRDGHTEQWATWYRTEDSTYVPAAIFSEVSNDNQEGVPLCS